MTTEILIEQEVITFIASQLNLPLVLFVDYPKRRATQWEHQEQIREYLSFRSFDSTQQEKLADFLLSEALQCDSGTFLIDLAYQKLRHQRIVRPGATTIERLVASIQNQAQDKVFGLILEQLSSCQKTFFNSILTVPEGKTYSLFQELKEAPEQASPNAFKKLIQRISLLRENGISELDFSQINPNKVKYLARLANYYSTSPMQRFADEKRCALMACFLRETLIETIDATIDMYDALIRGVFRRSKNDLANLTQKIASNVNEVDY